MEKPLNTDASKLLKYLRDEGLSRKNISVILGVSEQTLVRWESKKASPAKSDFRLIGTLVDVLKSVKDHSSSAEIRMIGAMILGLSGSKKLVEKEIKRGDKEFNYVSAVSLMVPFVGIIGAVAGVLASRMISEVLNKDESKKEFLEALGKFSENYGCVGLLYLAGAINSGMTFTLKGRKIKEENENKEGD